MRLVSLAIVVLLLLLLRKLLWCLLWLWCWRQGRPTPEPISFLPRRSGAQFTEHIERGEAPCGKH